MANTQIGNDGNGGLPRCVVIGTQPFTIGTVAGGLSLQTGLLSGATFTPARVFNPGESVVVQASGLLANAQANLCSEQSSAAFIVHTVTR